MAISRTPMSQLHAVAAQEYALVGFDGEVVYNNVMGPRQCAMWLAIVSSWRQIHGPLPMFPTDKHRALDRNQQTQVANEVDHVLGGVRVALAQGTGL